MNDISEQDPAKSLRPQAVSPYDASMEARVAVLEEIARNTEKMLERMDERMGRIEDRMTRIEDRMTQMVDRQTADVRWLLVLGIGATGFICALLGHGFHWF
jgi:hypothetical protein